MRLDVDPKVDDAFKKLFGSEENKPLLISLLKAILRENIVDAELLNPFSDKDSSDEKLSILDIKARFGDGRLVNVEMQMVITPIYPNRALFYWAKTHHQQLSAGEAYTQLRPTISIHTVNGVVFPDLTKYHSRYRPQEVDHPGLVFSKHLDIHLIELPKFLARVDHLTEPVERWCYFLKHGEDLEPESLPTNLRCPEIEKAVEVLEIMNHNDRERLLYEAHQRAWRDAVSLREDSFEEGKQAGEQIGVRKGVLESIEMLLEIKFGAESLSLMDRIRPIEDLDELRKIQQLLRTVGTVEEFRDRLANGRY